MDSKVWREGILKKVTIVRIGLSLIVIGIFLLILSNFQPLVITPTDWNNQINESENEELPKADTYQRFSSGDIVYIEGDVVSIERSFERSLYYIEIKITDNQNSCAFSHYNDFNNFSDINVHDHVFLRIIITEVLTPGGPNGTQYYRESAMLIDIEKEVISLRTIFLLIGIIFMIVGLIIELYYLFSKKKMNNEAVEKNIRTPPDESL